MAATINTATATLKMPFRTLARIYESCPKYATPLLFWKSTKIKDPACDWMLGFFCGVVEMIDCLWCWVIAVKNQKELAFTHMHELNTQDYTVRVHSLPLLKV